MHVLGTSREYVYIPVDPPASVPDVTVYPVDVALIADDGSEPGPADWKDAIWLGGEAALLVGPGGTAVSYADGDYMAFARVTAGLEQPVMGSGRVHVGM